MARFHRPKLIALDEDAATLREIERIATPWFDVLSTRDTRQAIAWVANDPSVEAVITEQVLSSSTGVTILESIRTMKSEVRRILITGHGDLAAIISGLHSGAVSRIVYKPIKPAELIAAIVPPGAIKATA
jgi:DNA-binding NtrC family response regulator